jgi:hypothetical protein
MSKQRQGVFPEVFTVTGGLGSFDYKIDGTPVGKPYSDGDFCATSIDIEEYLDFWMLNSPGGVPTEENIVGLGHHNPDGTYVPAEVSFRVAALLDRASESFMEAWEKNPHARDLDLVHGFVDGYTVRLVVLRGTKLERTFVVGRFHIDGHATDVTAEIIEAMHLPGARFLVEAPQDLDPAPTGVAVH